MNEEEEEDSEEVEENVDSSKIELEITKNLSTMRTSY